MTILGDPSLRKGIGNKQVQWKDDSGKIHSYILAYVLFFPNSPVKIMSITKLTHELNDETGTSIKTMGKNPFLVAITRKMNVLSIILPVTYLK